MLSPSWPGKWLICVPSVSYQWRQPSISGHHCPHIVHTVNPPYSTLHRNLSERNAETSIYKQAMTKVSPLPAPGVATTDIERHYYISRHTAVVGYIGGLLPPQYSFQYSTSFTTITTIIKKLKINLALNRNTRTFQYGMRLWTRGREMSLQRAKILHLLPELSM